MFDQLTEAQAQLFINLANLAENGSLISPFVPVPTGVDEYTIYLRGKRSFQLKSYDDLIALCVVGLLDWELTRMGAYKQFMLSKLGTTHFHSIDMLGVNRPNQRQSITSITQQLKAAIRHMINGAALENVLRDIDRVSRALQAETLNVWRIQRDVQSVGETITKRFDQVSLGDMSDVAISYGRWCQAISRIVEQDVENLYV